MFKSQLQTLRSSCYDRSNLWRQHLSFCRLARGRRQLVAASILSDEARSINNTYFWKSDFARYSPAFLPHWLKRCNWSGSAEQLWSQMHDPLCDSLTNQACFSFRLTGRGTSRSLRHFTVIWSESLNFQCLKSPCNHPDWTQSCWQKTITAPRYAVIISNTL